MQAERSSKKKSKEMLKIKKTNTNEVSFDGLISRLDVVKESCKKKCSNTRCVVQGCEQCNKPEMKAIEYKTTLLGDGFLYNEKGSGRNR